MVKVGAMIAFAKDVGAYNVEHYLMDIMFLCEMRIGMVGSNYRLGLEISRSPFRPVSPQPENAIIIILNQDRVPSRTHPMYSPS